MGSKFRFYLLVISMALLVLGSGCALTAQASPSADDPVPGATAQAERGWLGMALAPLTEKLAQRLGVQKQDGLVVVRVVAQGPAATAGVQRKDIVKSVNGTVVANLQEVRTVLANIKPNDTVTLSLLRGDQTLSLTITAAQALARGDKPALRPRLGTGGLFPHFLGMKDLQGVPRDEIFDHTLSSQYTVKDKDGKEITTVVTFGKVVNASDTSLTIVPNGKTNQITYRITADTNVRGKATDFKADDKVVVITKNSSSDAYAVFGAGLKLPQP